MNDPTTATRSGKRLSNFARVACSAARVIPTVNDANTTESSRIERDDDTDGTNVNSKNCGSAPSASAAAVE